MKYETIEHKFKPIFDEKSRILILGSLPSVKSRENNFYYGHPQNRFWKVIAGIFECEIPVTIEEKKEMLHENGIALWDVIARCDIAGSSDSSIKNVIPNDINIVLQSTPIKKVFANGAKAEELYNRFCFAATGVSIQKLPSTSPANAAWRLEDLICQWKKQLK